MPWNDNTGGGGGSRGSGDNNGQNPWGQRPSGGGGGGQEPPDLDEVVRQMQGQIRGMFGGGGGGDATKGGKGGGGGAVGLILIGLLVAWLFMGQVFFVVAPQEAGVIQRFGEFVRVEREGLHYKFPNPIETVILTNVTQIRNVEIGRTAEESLMLTADENIVDIDFTVQWRVAAGPNAIRDFEFNIRDQSETVKAVAESAMREVVGTTNLQPIITSGRTVVAQRTQDIMQRTLDEYAAGIEIVEVQLQRADPPAGAVVAAFREVDAARQEAETTVFGAQAHANEVVPVARGAAAQLIAQAEGYRESQVAVASGSADRFVLIHNEYLLAPEVTRQRMYLETMEVVLGRSELLLIDQDGGAVPYLPLNELGNSRPATRGGN